MPDQPHNHSEPASRPDAQATTDLTAIHATPDQTTDLPSTPENGPDTGRRAETSVEGSDPQDPSFESEKTGPYDPKPKKKKKSFKDLPLPTIPGYEVLGVLGRGGMGVVYKARQAGLGRLVALKTILAGPHASDQAVARFLMEAQAVARFQHPNIVQIYEIGEFNGLPYFSLEYVEGGTLIDRIQGQPQPPAFAAETLESLARAMHYSHERGIVHRDLKPGNVLMAQDGTPKIADFGLAKAFEEEAGQTVSGQVLGSPSYMAPEQARGEADKAGPPADVYALGAILYDLLTGRPPFVGSSLMETLEMVRKQEPVAPNLFTAKLPRDLETICLKCLQKEPVKRYATASDLADDLKRFREGRPIVARPVGRAERAWRWARRNPTVAGLGSAIAALVLTVAAVTSVLSWQLAVKKDEAETNAANAIAARDREEIERKKAEAERDQKEKARAAEEAAKREAEAKRLESEAARAVTSEQRKLALNTVRTVFLSIDDLMRYNARLAPTRLKIIEKLLADLDKIRDHALSNPLDARTEAIAFTRIGEIYYDTNRVTEAEAWLTNARFGLKARAEDDIPDANDRLAALFNYANTTNKCADVAMRLGDGAKAKQLYTEALEVRKRRIAISEETKDEFKINTAKSQVATSYRLIAYADLLLGDPASAEANLREADKRFAALPPRAAGSLGTRRERAEIQVRLGDAVFRQGRTADAEKHYRDALKERKELVRITPRPPEIVALVKHDLVLAQIALADFLLVGRNDPAGAKAEVEIAGKLIEELSLAEPDNLVYRQVASGVEYRLGVLTTGDAAKAHFKKCLDLRRESARFDPRDVQSAIELMLALCRSGEAAEAEKVANALLWRSGKDRRILFQCACGFAVIAGSTPRDGDRYRGRAFAVLSALLALGWKDRVALETDPDLAALRADSRFQHLLQKLTPGGP